MDNSLPDLSSGSLAVPQPASGVASYEPPNWRQVGMAGELMASTGRGMGQVSDILTAANDRQDQVTVLNAATRYKAAQLGLEKDPDGGFDNVRGNGVIGPQFVDSFMEKAKNVQSLIADSLTSDSQRQLFAQHAEVLNLQFQSALLEHQAKQTIAFNATTRDDAIKTSLADIAAHPYDDARYEANQLLMGKTVVDAGKEMGLTGDALANFVRVGTAEKQSKGLLYRTNGMLRDNPMKAADFFQEHQLEFSPDDRMQLAPVLKTAVDAQTSRVLGNSAYQAAIGAQVTPSLPANMNADTVKPYDAARINQVVEQVRKPSPYDAAFSKYAQQYGVNPLELKLRAVVESGMNKDAENPSGAVGLMQFTPDTAKTYGIDPKDPDQSIAAAAKLMAMSGGTVGADMSKVDRAYYGGNVNAKGTNTDQYVENLRAVRQQLLGAAAPALTQDFLEGAEGRVIDNARTYAQQNRPGDLVYQDMVVAEARKNWATSLSAIRGQNQQTISNIMGLLASDTPPKTVSDLPITLQKAYSDLPGSSQAELRSRMANGDKAPTQQSTNLYYALLGQATNPETQADFADTTKTNLAAHFGDMPYSQLSQLMNLQASINKKDAQQQARTVNLQHALTLAENYALKPMGIMIPNKDTPQNKRQAYDQFTGRLVEALDNFKAANGKPPADKDIVSISKGLTANVTIPGENWYNRSRSVPAFSLTPDQESQATIPMTDAQRADIVSTLTARYGFQPNEAMVQQAQILQTLHPGDLDRLKAFDQTMRNFGRSSPASGTAQPAGAPTPSVTPAVPATGKPSSIPGTRAKDFYSDEAIAQRKAFMAASQTAAANPSDDQKEAAAQAQMKEIADNLSAMKSRKKK